MPIAPYVPEDLFKMSWVGSPKISPSGRHVAFVVSEVQEKENGYASSIWLFDREAQPYSPSWVRRITYGRGDRNPKWSPSGNMIGFTSSRDGKNQVFVLDMAGGEARPVTKMPKGAGDFDWLDNSTLVVSAKEEKETPKQREGSTARRITTLRYKFNGAGYLDALKTQLWRVSVDGPEPDESPQRLTDGKYDCSSPVASPTGKYVVFSSDRSGDELSPVGNLWLLHVDSGELTKLTTGKGSARGPVFAPDETAIYYLGHEKGRSYPGAYSDIWSVDLSGQHRKMVSKDFPYQIGGGIGGDVGPDSGRPLTVSSWGRFLYFVAVDGGSSYLYRMDVEDGSWDVVFGEGQMVTKSYDVRGEALVVNKATPVTAGDLWYGKVPPLENNSDPQEPMVMFTGRNSELASSRYAGWPRRMTFNHPDGTKLEGWVIFPNGYEEGKKYPLVMEIHGGPHTTYGNVFFHEFQMLAGHGFGVFYANPRGSMGYGEGFARAVVGDWCGVDAADLEFMAREAIKTLDWVDPQCVGVTGGSQGGYFTNWLIGHTDIFNAAVTQRSMSNLYSKYGVSDIGWSGDRAGMGGLDLWDHEDFIMERSPIRYAPNVKAPTLIIHSDQDYRCPLEQAEQWYVALKRLGVTVEMLLFHGENHELSRGGKPANRVVRLEGILGWFQRFLDPGSKAPKTDS